MNHFGDIRIYEALRVEGRRVLDLGADHGMTPLFFLAHDANMVVASELDRDNRAALHAISYCEPRLVSVGPVNRAKDIEKLIFNFKINRVKCDIDGDETYICDIPNKIVKTCNWIIETHGEEIHEQLIQKFQKCNLKTKVIEELGVNKILYAGNN